MYFLLSLNFPLMTVTKKNKSIDKIHKQDIKLSLKLICHAHLYLSTNLCIHLCVQGILSLTKILFTQIRKYEDLKQRYKFVIQNHIRQSKVLHCYGWFPIDPKAKPLDLNRLNLFPKKFNNSLILFKPANALSNNLYQNIFLSLPVDGLEETGEIKTELAIL